MDDTQPTNSTPEETSEVTTEEKTTESDDTANLASNLLLVEEKIKQHLADIQRLQGQYKEQRNMFEDSFANDANYKELNDKAKEANRLKNAAKQQILRSPAIQELSNKVKAMKEELADLQDSLSDYLREYQRTTGSNVFVGDNGEELEIVHVTKLVRRNSKYRP
jgi:predicted  nucleic acid-binding Zn-ribbon protein